MNEDQRIRPRLLCPDTFSDSEVTQGKLMTSCVSVNFHRYGIAINSISRLESSSHCHVQFSYSTFDGKLIEVESLLCDIKYRQELETGNQYGLAFVNADQSYINQQTKLLAIELDIEQNSEQLEDLLS